MTFGYDPLPESTMKAIAKKREWTYDEGDTAQKLINVMLANDLIPPAMQSHFSALKGLLESGVPTVRNKMGGHGQGADIVETPAYMVSFALNAAASAILLLTRAEKELP